MEHQAISWTRSVKPQNEDAVCTGPGFMLVVDGASSLTGDPDMNRWTSRFTDVLVKEVAARLTAGTETAAVLRSGIEQAQLICGSHGVTATLSLARWGDDSVELTLLGDSPVIWDTGDGAEVVIDPAFEFREVALLERVLADVRGGVEFPAAYGTVLEDLRGGRDTRNTDEGVWVVSDCNDAGSLVAHMHCVSRPCEGLVRLAVMTDGAAAAVETFGVVDFSELLKLCESRGLPELFEDLDARELADPECSRYPRFSYRDDATIALARFN